MTGLIESARHDGCCTSHDCCAPEHGDACPGAHWLRSEHCQEPGPHGPHWCPEGMLGDLTVEDLCCEVAQPESHD